MKLRGQAEIPLSPRQREIHALMAQGLSDKDIAQRLGMALGTVKIHGVELRSRIGARNRVEAALMFHGLQRIGP